MSEQRLAEIRARAEAATEGPWEPCQGYGPTFFGNVRGEYLRGVGDINFGVGEQAEADLAFVLGAREDVPVLLAEVDRLRRALGEATGHVAELDSEIGGWSARVAELEQQLAAVRAATAEAVMCGDGPCLVGSHLPRLERVLGGVGLLRAAEGGERP